MARGQGTDNGTGDNSGEGGTPEVYGKDGEGMGYKPGTLEYFMANLLANTPESDFPSDRIEADAVRFYKNSARLRNSRKKTNG